MKRAGKSTAVRRGQGRLPAWAAGMFVLASLMAQGRLLAQAPGSDRPQWMDAPPTSTGIAVGEKIPSFRAPDQNGRMQDFASIRGPKGAVIMFNRSADW